MVIVSFFSIGVHAFYIIPHLVVIFFLLSQKKREGGDHEVDDRAR